MAKHFKLSALFSLGIPMRLRFVLALLLVCMLFGVSFFSQQGITSAKQNPQKKIDSNNLAVGRFVISERTSVKPTQIKKGDTHNVSQQVYRWGEGIRQLGRALPQESSPEGPNQVILAGEVKAILDQVNGRVLVSAVNGNSSPKELSLPSGAVDYISVDESGEVYALDRRPVGGIWRLTETGPEKLFQVNDNIHPYFYTITDFKVRNQLVYIENKNSYTEEYPLFDDLSPAERNYPGRISESYQFSYQLLMESQTQGDFSLVKYTLDSLSVWVKRFSLKGIEVKEVMTLQTTHDDKVLIVIRGISNNMGKYRAVCFSEEGKKLKEFDIPYGKNDLMLNNPISMDPRTGSFIVFSESEVGITEQVFNCPFYL